MDVTKLFLFCLCRFVTIYIIVRVLRSNREMLMGAVLLFGHEKCREKWSTYIMHGIYIYIYTVHNIDINIYWE